MDSRPSISKPMITAKFDSKLLNEKMKKVAATSKETIKDLIKQRGRLLARDLAYETAPFGLDKKAKMMGENTIKGDLLGRERQNGEKTTKRSALFFVVDGKYINKFSKENPNGIEKLWISKEGRVYGVEKTFFKPNASVDEMRAHHKQYYVNGRRTRAGTYARDVGRWRFIDKMTVTKAAMNRYLKYVYARVGMSKAGWVAAGSKLGKVTGIPAWVSRHATNVQGEGKIKLSTNGDASITLTNKLPWGDKVISASQINSVLELNKEKFIAALKYKLKEYVKKSSR